MNPEVKCVHRLLAIDLLLRAGIPKADLESAQTLHNDLAGLIESIAQDLAAGLPVVTRRNPDGSIDYFSPEEERDGGGR